MVKNNLMVTTEQLLKIRFHLAHKKNKLNPKMIPFVYGFRHRITILNLEQIAFNLKVISKGLIEIFAKRGTIFLASTQSNLPIYEYFKNWMKIKNNDIDSNIYVNGFIAFKWINGLYTNYFFYRKLMDQITAVSEKSLNSRDKKYLKYLEGVQQRNYFPVADLAVLFGYNIDAVKEFNLLQIPIVGLIDSDANKDKFTYGIPGNDDSIEVFQFFVEYIKMAEFAGRKYEKYCFQLLCLSKLERLVVPKKI